MLLALQGGDAAVRTVPDIIKQASASPLGIFALIILGVGVLAFYFFRTAPVNVRTLIFVMMFMGVVLYGFAITRVAKGDASLPPGSTPGQAGSTNVLGTIPPNGGPPGSNTAFLNFKDSDIRLDRTKSFKPGDPSYFLAPADGDYRVDAALAATYDPRRTVADYMSFYLVKMSADKVDWEGAGGTNDVSRMPRGNISTSVHLQKGVKLALRAGNAAGTPIDVAGTFSVQQIN